MTPTAADVQRIRQQTRFPLQKVVPLTKDEAAQRASEHVRPTQYWRYFRIPAALYREIS